VSNIDRRRALARARPSEAYLERRRQLIDAAAKVMGRKGFRDTTLGDIAHEIGADRGSLYYYVSSKDELLTEILYEAMVEHHKVLSRIARSRRTPPEKLRAMIASMMEAFDAHFPYLYIWVYEDPSRLGEISAVGLDEIVDLSERSYELLRETIAAGIAKGHFTSTLPIGVLAQSILGLVAWTFRWYEPGKGQNAQEIADGLADLALGGLQISS